MSVVYDKLSFTRRLEGEHLFSRPQAEARAEAMHDALSETVCPKADLASGTAELRHEIALLRSELKLWLGSMAAALFAALFTSLGGLMAIFKFLVH